MAFKFIILATFVTFAQAGVIPTHDLGYAAGHAIHAAPVAVAHAVSVHDAEYDPHPQYSYAYDVQDPHTGDYKHQQETRDGDVVQGSYSLLEADGTRRVVEYTADPHHGFNAVVHKEPGIHAAPIAQHVAPVAVAHHATAPIALAHHAAPVAVAAHTAPLAYAAHTAPLAYAAHDAHHHGGYY